MLFELNSEKNCISPISGLPISASIGGNEKMLEHYLRSAIGDIVFPEYFVFGNERSFQEEADLFAVNGCGDLVVIELKVDGHYDRGKVYQAMSYAQRFSRWRYDEMNSHYQKCFARAGNLIDGFEEHFGYRIEHSDFNRHQKILIISHSSSPDTNAITRYWKSVGVEIEEYYYRFYDYAGKLFFELSNELFFNRGSGCCWINTCRTHIPDAVFDMVAHRKAAIYEERRGLIGKWMSKSHVFLYHNGYGIIAAGKGTASIFDGHNQSLQVNERSIKLSEFIHGVSVDTKQIRTSIPPRKIKELLNRDFYFPNSIVSISEKDATILRKECELLFK